MAGRETILVDIDLRKIPAEYVKEFERRNGNPAAISKLVIATLREPDQYGNTHTVYLHRNKEQRDEGQAVIYIGNGKRFSPSGGGYTSPSRSQEDDVDPF